MDSGHSNEARWPNNTLLTYTLQRTVKVRESVGVGGCGVSSGHQFFSILVGDITCAIGHNRDFLHILQSRLSTINSLPTH